MSYHRGGSGSGQPPRKQFTIKPFRSYTQMDASVARSTFASLASAMDEIHNRNASTLSFEELYRNAYNLVLHKHGALLYDGVRDRLAHHLRASGGRLVRLAREGDALDPSAASGGGSQRYRLLEETVAAWREHRVTMVMVRDIFMYMDRTYVPQNRKRPVYDLGLHLFRRVVWERDVDDLDDGGTPPEGKSGGGDASTLGGAAGRLILRAVREDRLGRLDDAPQRSALLRSLVHMLLELAHSRSGGDDPGRGGDGGAPVYERDFEEAFLGETQEFYRVESSGRLSDAASGGMGGPSGGRYSAMEYVRGAQSRLAEEDRRAQALDLPTPTRSALLRIAETELIDRHARTLVDMEGSGFAAVLRVVATSPAGASAAAAGGDGRDAVPVDRERIADLGRMYDLFSRVPSSVNHLRDALGERIRADGRALVRDQEGGASPPAAFVRGVLAMRERFAAVVTDAMGGEKRAQKRMREAFEDFLNADARAANCLAVYVDELLRGGLRGADERRVARELDRVIVVFRYLSDKDVFEAYYKSHLAKRLLGGKSGNEEAEKAMVSLLKAECGYQFTSKLEGMFNDMRISRETAEKYRSHKRAVASSNAGGAGGGASSDERDASNGGRAVDVEVSVLSNSHWPTQAVAMCTLPPPVEAAMDRFQRYYLSNYTGRKLAWQTSTGTAEVRATLPPAKGSGRPRRHDLTVTTYQMCILVLFNDADVLTLAEIRDRTHIPEDELRRHLVSLCTPKHRILRKGSKGKFISGDSDTFTYNAEYTSKMTKVKVPTVSMRDAGGGTAPGAGSGPSSAGAAGPAAAGSAAPGAAGGAPSIPPSVEEDRRHLLEASIVRIMKARKTSSHNDLVAEVTRQLSGRFVPSPQFVKKRVESLIEREYLERDEGDRRVYKYVA